MKRIAVITGASSGMGRRFAETVDTFGRFDEVWVIARHEAALEGLRERVPFPVRPLALDLTDRSSFATYAKALTEEPVEVLSMYDGMSCGHIALDKLGVDITVYYATEIDKYAAQTTQHNFPDTVQLGDAFQVRAEDWRLPEPVGMEAPANG